MRRRTLGVKKEPSIMIIPMIDIVFFLLVFFMVGTLYMNSEQQIPVQLPATSSSSTKAVEPTVITVTSSGKIYVDKQEVTQANLQVEVLDRVANNPRQVFIVRAAKDVYYNDVVALIDMLKLNGAKYISIATDRK